MSIKIYHIHGQMANQLFILSNLIGDAIEKNETLNILIPKFDLREFENIRNSKILRFPLFPKFIFQIDNILKNRFYQPYYRLIKNLIGNKYTIFILRKILKTNFIFSLYEVDVSIPKSPNRVKYIDEIINLLKINEVRQFEIKQNFTKENSTIILGVHVRHGDYVNFLGGKYYYSIEQYSRFISQFQTLFVGKKIIIFLSSNVKISLNTELEQLNISSRDAYSDIISLSNCDYILGPPSTFSAWASLTRNVPIYLIEDPEKEMTLSSFEFIFDKWIK